MPERVGTDQRTVGEAGPVEGDNEAPNGSDKLVVKFNGEKEEKHVIGKNGDNEGVNVKNTTGK